jgi:hypothetical protein
VRRGPQPSTAIHCLNGNLLRALIGFGRLDDERVGRSIDWQAATITGEGEIRFYRSSLPGPGFRCGANEGLPWVLAPLPVEVDQPRSLAFARLPRRPRTDGPVHQPLVWSLTVGPGPARSTAGAAPSIVDDMISTGGTISTAVRALLDAGARPEIFVAATHGLFVAGAAEQLHHRAIKGIWVCDTLPQAGEPDRTVVPGAPLIAAALERIRHVHDLE